MWMGVVLTAAFYTAMVATVPNHKVHMEILLESYMRRSTHW
jgi:hypothetical protein